MKGMNTNGNTHIEICNLHVASEVWLWDLKLIKELIHEGKCN
jgi:hypothetical protein